MEKKKLDPNDFPIVVNGNALVTHDGTVIAAANSEAMAADIAYRLNEDAARKREDRWAL